jgi:hypothetical protein
LCGLFQGIDVKALDVKKLAAMDAGVIAHLSVEQVKALSAQQVRTPSRYIQISK